LFNSFNENFKKSRTDTMPALLLLLLLLSEVCF